MTRRTNIHNCYYAVNRANLDPTFTRITINAYAELICFPASRDELNFHACKLRTRSSKIYLRTLKTLKGSKFTDGTVY